MISKLRSAAALVAAVAMLLGASAPLGAQSLTSSDCAPTCEPSCTEASCDVARPDPVATLFSPVTSVARMVCRDFKRNNCWPAPFVCPDRQAVREPFVRMVAKGWTRENTLGDHHFEPETGKLTYAGVLKVRKILLLGPIEHRTIYVYRAMKPEETAARVDAVQQLAADTLRTGQLPAVLETNLPAPGWPADQVDNVSRRYRATMPDPRLPAASGEQDSSGS